MKSKRIRTVVLTLLTLFLGAVLFMTIGTRIQPIKNGEPVIYNSLCMSALLPEGVPDYSLQMRNVACDAPLNRGTPFVYLETTFSEFNTVNWLADIAVWMAISAAVVLGGNWIIQHFKKKK